MTKESWQLLNNFEQNIIFSEYANSIEERESLAEKKYYRQKELQGHKSNRYSREEDYAR